MNIINNSQILGSLDQNLVLNTLSKIYVRVGDKYHELNFIDQPKGNEISDSKNPIIQTSGSDIIVVSDISELSYPGDDKFIIASNGPEFYITKNGEIKNVTPTLTSISPVQQSPSKLITINNANVIGQLYGDNLVIDFDNNEISVKKLTVKNLVADSLTVKNNTRDQFVSGSGKMYIGPEINVTKVIKKDNFVYFIFAYPQKIKHFSVTQHVTNEYDSFDGEIIEITEEFAKVRVISGDYENSTKLILKSDFLQHDKKWGSIYNRSQNIRIGDITESGEYLDLEFATINSDVTIQVKSGTLLKCLRNCTINVIIDGRTNTYELYKDSVYLVKEDQIINLTCNVRLFSTKSEFEDAVISESDLVIIKETSQLYYQGVFIGSEKTNDVFNNFEIANAVNGALIVYKDGIWQPTYDYATYSYVDAKLNDLLNRAPEALNTLGEIATVLQNNVNNVGDILLAIRELTRDISNKVSIEEFSYTINELESKINQTDNDHIIELLDTKASIESLNEINAKFEYYVTKGDLYSWFDPGAINVLASNLNNVQLSVSNLTNKVITHELQIKLLQNNQTLISESISTTIENLDTINQELIDLNKKVANISQYGNNSIDGIPIHINNLENGDILIYNGSVWSNTPLSSFPIEENNYWHTGNSGSLDYDWSANTLRMKTLVIPTTIPINLAAEEWGMYLNESGIGGEVPEQGEDGGENEVFDIDALWEELGLSNSNRVIDESHIPLLGISKINGLENKLSEFLLKAGGTITGDLTVKGRFIPNTFIVPQTANQNIENGEWALYLDINGVGGEGVGGSGTGSFDPLALWAELESEDPNKIIDATHIPLLEISKINGLRGLLNNKLESSDLNGYAKESWVTGQGYALDSDVKNTYATKFDLTKANNNITTLQGYFTNGSAKDALKLGGIDAANYWHKGNSGTLDYNWKAKKLNVRTLVIPTSEPTDLSQGEVGFYLGTAGQGAEEPNGSGGLDLTELWAELSSEDYAKKIHISHIPTIQYSSIAGRPSALVNPYALTINGVRYDGSEPISLDISAGGGVADSVAWSNVTGKPTTLGGYGITDAISTSGGIITGLTTIKRDAVTPLVIENTATTNTLGQTILRYKYGGSYVSALGAATDGYLYRYNSDLSSSYQLLDSGNYSSYALPLSGGTIKNGSVRNPLSIDTTDSTGAYLVMKANGASKAYFGYDSSLGALIQDNSSSSTVLYIRDGHGYIGNQNKWNTLIHSGNIGSQRVDAATRLVRVGSITDANTITFTDYSLRWYSAIANTATNLPSFSGYQNGLLALPLHSSGTTAQIYMTAGGYLGFRGTATSAWKQIAFTDGNVASADYATTAGSANALNGISSKNYAYYNPGNGYLGFNINDYTLAPYGQGDGYIEYYDNGAYYNSVWGWVMAVNGFKGNADSATKLQTARTIWGQSFDGSANVSGDMSNVGVINSFIKPTKESSSVAYLHITNFSSSAYDGVHMYIANKDNSNNLRPLVLQNGFGNVLIGTTTDNGSKLQVNGTIEASELVIPTAPPTNPQAGKHYLYMA